MSSFQLISVKTLQILFSSFSSVNRKRSHGIHKEKVDIELYWAERLDSVNIKQIYYV